MSWSRTARPAATRDPRVGDAGSRRRSGARSTPTPTSPPRSRTSSSGPGLVRGSFDPEFLELPEEITTTAMSSAPEVPAGARAVRAPPALHRGDGQRRRPQRVHREGQRVGLERPARGRALLLRGGRRGRASSRACRAARPLDVPGAGSGATPEDGPARRPRRGDRRGWSGGADLVDFRGADRGPASRRPT